MIDVSQLSPFVLVVMILTLVISVGTQIQNGKKLFGQWQVPLPVVVWVGVVLPGVSVALGVLQKYGDLQLAHVVSAIYVGLLTALLGGAPPGLLALHKAPDAMRKLDALHSLLSQQKPANDVDKSKSAA